MWATPNAPPPSSETPTAGQDEGGFWVLRTQPIGIKTNAGSWVRRLKPERGIPVAVRFPVCAVMIIIPVWAESFLPLHCKNSWASTKI